MDNHVCITVWCRCVVCMQVHMCFQRRTLDVLLYCLLPYSLEKRSGTEPGARLVIRRPYSLPKLFLTALGVLVHIAMLAFYMGTGNLNSGPRTCILLFMLSGKSLYGKYSLSSLYFLNFFIQVGQDFKVSCKKIWLIQEQKTILEVEPGMNSLKIYLFC